MADRRVRLGTVCVDSGQLLIVDPCYLESTWIQHDGTARGDEHASYNDVCDITMAPPLYAGQTLNNLAVAFRSGIGDGEYAVVATIGDVPGWGERIKKIEIELIPDDDNEERERELAD